MRKVPAVSENVRASHEDAESPLASAAVEVDSLHALIRIVAGPYLVAGGMAHHQHDASMEVSVLRVTWPVDGRLRGYQVVLCDADDPDRRPLPREMIHHVGLTNFSRRELLYPMSERLLAAGGETADVLLPSGVAVPLQRGDTLGLYAGLHSNNGRAIAHAYLILTLPWESKRGHRPIEVLPFYADVNNVIGGSTAFDLPPGHSVRSAEFTLPIAGRLLALGGHLHDYGVALRLEDAQSGKSLVRLRADRAADGHIRGLGRFNFGFHEDALHLERGHRYRVVAEYDNSTGKMLPLGGMGSIAGPFAPDDLAQWPSLDREDPSLERDAASLTRNEMSMP